MLRCAQHDVLSNPRCVVPEGDGVILEVAFKAKLWGKHHPAASAQGRPPPAPCPARCRTRPRAGHPLRPRPAGGGQVERPGPDGSGRARPRTRLRGAHPGGRSRHRLVAPAPPLAPRRLPQRPAGGRSAPAPPGPAPPFPAPRPRPLAPGRGGGRHPRGPVQGLPPTSSSARKGGKSLATSFETPPTLLRDHTASPVRAAPAPAARRRCSPGC